MELIKDNRKWTTWNKRLLLAMLVGFLLICTLYLMGALGYYFYGISWKFSSTMNTIEDATIYTGYVYNFGIYIAWMLVFLVWMYRAYSNLHKLGEPKLYHKSWVIIGWFIPIVNLIIPYRILKQLFVASVRISGDHDLSLAKRIVWQLNACWTLWLVHWGLSLSLRLIAVSIDSRKIIPILGIIASVMMLLSLVFILSKLRLIRTYSILENRMHKQMMGDKGRMESDSLIDSI